MLFCTSYSVGCCYDTHNAWYSNKAIESPGMADGCFTRQESQLRELEIQTQKPPWFASLSGMLPGNVEHDPVYLLTCVQFSYGSQLILWIPDGFKELTGSNEKQE